MRASTTSRCAASGHAVTAKRGPLFSSPRRAGQYLQSRQRRNEGRAVKEVRRRSETVYRRTLTDFGDLDEAGRERLVQHQVVEGRGSRLEDQRILQPQGNHRQVVDDDFGTEGD